MITIPVIARLYKYVLDCKRVISASADVDNVQAKVGQSNVKIVYNGLGVDMYVLDLEEHEARSIIGILALHQSNLMAELESFIEAHRIGNQDWDSHTLARAITEHLGGTKK